MIQGYLLYYKIFDILSLFSQQVCCCWCPFDCLLLLASFVLLTPQLLLESMLLLLVRVAPSSSAVAGAPLIAYSCWRPFCYLLLLASILLPTPLLLPDSLLVLLVQCPCFSYSSTSAIAGVLRLLAVAGIPTVAEIHFWCMIHSIAAPL
jgi:hypothetical protein